MGMAGFHLLDQLRKAIHQVSTSQPSILASPPLAPLANSAPPPFPARSIAKWLPQLILNYTRQSTHGFSIYVILLDLIGSLTSLAELVLSSWLAHDPAGVTGNPVKLGLSVLTIAFDAVFVVQRYVLYGAAVDGEDEVPPSSQPDEETPLLGP